MKFSETNVNDARIISLVENRDERGSFARIWCERELSEQGVTGQLVQASLSVTVRAGTVRGMHYQPQPSREGKFVRCIRGAVHDAIIDLRSDSPTFARTFSVELNEANREAIYVPPGCAHGFQSLVDDVELLYLMTDCYDSNASLGVRWNDPAFDIEWPIPISVINERDRSWPDFMPLRFNARRKDCR